ncbi:MAG: ABC transporter permease [Leptospira sp.]|nr:ABC transporter permease [Leptospira sp.]
MKSEFFRFVFFILCLSLISSFISSFRSQDRRYTYADSGISSEEVTSEDSFLIRASIEYLSFCKSLIVGDGQTIAGESVYSHIAERLLPTFHLAIFSILFGSFFGIFFSLFALYLRNKFFDEVLSRIAEIILSTPVFVFSILLLILFFYKWELLPPGGYEPLQTYYVILPGIALGIRVFARVYLFQAKEVWTESNSSYVLLLQTRAYPWRHIVFSEIFRKVLPFTLIIIILDFSSLISGAMIVEEIFFYPGIGKSLFYSIKSMDSILLATLLMYVGIVFYIMNRITFYWQKYLLGESNV